MIEFLASATLFMIWNLLWFDWGSSVGKRVMVNNFKNYGKSVYQNKIHHCNKIESVLKNEETEQ